MQEKRPFTPRDIAKLTTLNSVQAVGDTGFLIYHTARDLEANSFKESWSIVDFNGNTILQYHGSSPQLSPNGKLVAFEQDGLLWSYDIKSHDVKSITEIYSSDYFMGHMADQNFVWSPDSSSIAYISTHPVSGSAQDSINVVDNLLYKTKGGRGRRRFAGKEPYHIWIVFLNGDDPKCITPGPFNEHSITWSPDGNFIAFISDRSGDPDRTHKNDLFTINIHTLQVQCIVSGRGTRFKPIWSPTGELIAFSGDESSFTSKDSPAPDVHVYTVDPAGNEIQCHTKSIDRRTDNLKWSADGNHIFFNAGDQGTTGVYSMNLHEKVVRKLIDGPFYVKDYCIDYKANQAAFIKNSSSVPDELYLSKLEHGDTARAITFFNNEALNDFMFAGADTFWCRSDDDTSIQGWLMKPCNFNASHTYPCILVIHGGPHNMYGFEFDEKLQVLSAAGFGVVFINPRGSTGYGQEFVNGNLRNWGGKDYEDLMAGVRFVVDHNPWINRDKLYVTGQSYGGFMTNWIITQTNIFKAAVSDGGLSNLISFAGTSLYHCLIEAEFNGDTWNNYELLWKWSPLKYVKSVTTSTLFLHGETDNEVPITQSEEMFSALKRLGVETQLVRYQDEGHGWRPDLLPLNRLDLYERMINWFRRF